MGLTKEDLIKRLKELQSSDDLECAHGEADALLLRFIDDEEVEEAFDEIDKWYA